MKPSLRFWTIACASFLMGAAQANRAAAPEKLSPGRLA